MWTEKYRNRYRWAYEAYQRFIDEVDPSLVNDFRRASRVTIAVYGATQVGKTTLILDLLGVTGEALERASGVLRGEQRLGKSSTACAIRYGRSKDNYWYIGDDSDALDDEAARIRFSAIRAELEQGQAQSVEVLPVRLPAMFFGQRDENTLSLELCILDIPGINAVNEAEQAQVARVVEMYVATADLILLVGRADDLGFLHPSKLKMTALNDWMLQPNRYRVVLSYTFSPASFKTWFGQAGRTLEEVRAKLYQELSTHDYDPPKSVEAMLFPLEFGDSLRSLGVDEDYHQAAASLIAQLRCELLASITQSASPYARLAAAFKIKQLIEARRTREQSEYSRRKNMLDSALQNAKSALASSKQLMTECQSESRLLCSQERRLRRYTKMAESTDMRRVFTLPLSCARKSVNELKDAAFTFESGIRARWQKLCARYAGYQANSRLAELSPPDTHALNSFYQKMNGYRIDRYCWPSENFLSDCRMLHWAAKEIIDTYTEAATREVHKYLEQQQSALIQKKRNHDRRSDIMFIAVEKQKQALEEAQYRCEQSDQAYAQFEMRMQFSIEHSHKFEQYILEAFQAEFDRVREAIRCPANATEQLYDLFYLNMLPGELDKMLEGKNF